MKADGRRPLSVKPDSIGVIELELLKLVRHLETFGRRSSLYLEVDRAGYLALRMLEAMGPVSTKALAGALNLDASTVTRQITALEKRASSNDARILPTGARPPSS